MSLGNILELLAGDGGYPQLVHLSFAETRAATGAVGVSFGGECGQVTVEFVIIDLGLGFLDRRVAMPTGGSRPVVCAILSS